MVSAVAAMALLSGLPFGGLFQHNPDIVVAQSRVMGWDLQVNGEDHFSNQTSCKLDRSGIEYKHGVVSFQFGHGVNTADAEFRVDGGAPRPTVTVALEAAGLGAHLGGDNMRNPSNGSVYIPASVLAGARTVSIRPDSRSSHRDFSLAGLPEALSAAKEKNCDVV